MEELINCLNTLVFNITVENTFKDSQLSREGNIMYKNHQLIGYADDVARRKYELKKTTKRMVEAAHGMVCR